MPSRYPIEVTLTSKADNKASPLAQKTKSLSEKPYKRHPYAAYTGA